MLSPYDNVFQNQKCWKHGTVSQKSLYSLGVDLGDSYAIVFYVQFYGRYCTRLNLNSRRPIAAYMSSHCWAVLFTFGSACGANNFVDELCTGAATQGPKKIDTDWFRLFPGALASSACIQLSHTCIQ